MASENIVEITSENWQGEVIESSVPVLVDFWAEWCGPCRMIAPVLEQLATELGGTCKVAKVDVDQNQKLAGEFTVKSIPTLLVIKDGKEVERMVGALTKSALTSKLEPHLG